jgi:hypothetical protein
MAFQTTYDFEELKLPGLGEGCLLYGQATLIGNGDGDFYVSEIRLGGRTLPRFNVMSGNDFEQSLFKAIADVLENDKTTDGRHCAQEWADAVEQSTQPDPDQQRQERMDNAIHFTGHNTAARLERALQEAAQ